MLRLVRHLEVCVFNVLMYMSFEENTTQPWFNYFQIAGKYLHSFKTNPLNIIVDDSSI